MTWDRPRYRLMVEGWPHEWVTDYTLEDPSLTCGRVRYSGLDYGGLEVNEQLDLRECRLDVSGMGARIRADQSLESFTKQAKIVTYLISDVDHDQTAGITLMSVSGISTGQRLHLGTEVWKVHTVSATNTTIGVYRQQWDTQAQGHYLTYGEDSEEVPLWDRPPTMEGRRAYIFKYNDGDESDGKRLFDFASDYKGSSTLTSDDLIWRGLVAGAPTLDDDGSTWDIDIAPATMILEQGVAARSDKPVTPTGIYHHAGAPFIIVVSDPGIPTYAAKQIVGYYNTEADFLDAVQTELDDIKDNWLSDVPEYLYITWDAAARRHRVMLKYNVSKTQISTISFYSALEGSNDGFIWKALSTDVDIAYGDLAASGEYYLDLFLDDRVYYTNESMAGVPSPRGLVGDPELKGTLAQYQYVQSQAAAFPSSRIYYAGILDVDVGDSIMFEAPHPMNLTKSLVLEAEVAVIADNYVDITNLSQHVTSAVVGNASVGVVIMIDGATMIQPMTLYATSSTVADFLDAVVTKAEKANLGNVPFVTYADVADWAAVVDKNYLPVADTAIRDYLFMKESVLLEILSEELKLIGCFMRLASDGRITIAPLEVVSGTDLSAVAITDDDIITPGDGKGAWPTWEPGRDGVVGTVEVATGYNQVEDEHDGELHIIRSVRTISTHKNRSRGVVSVAPRSRLPGGVMGEDAALLVALKIFSVHGHDYDVVTIKVRMGLMDTVFCGTGVRVTSSHIIDSATGQRGVSLKPGIVIGRRFPLDPAVGEATLTIRFNHGDYGGYAPACRCTNAANVAGNQWDLTTEANHFAPSGYSDLDYFAAGYKIRVTEYDDYTPGTQTGEVDSITGTNVRVTFDGAAPFGAGAIVYDLEFVNDNGATPTDAQLVYVYVADAAGKRNTGDPRVFA